LKFINSSLLWIFLFSLILFTGCSQKNADIDYDKFYKDTNNPKINNSRTMHKYTMRPYSVFGTTYYPFVANIGDDFDGIASWYGPNFHSKKTSNGEIYDMYDMTAAHKTLPMNTVLKVENLDNGRVIIVRVNDRGPFVSGRIIDLSNKAAHEIDMYRKGTAKVKITVLGYNGEIENKNGPSLETPRTVVATQPVESGVDALEPLEIKEDNIKSTKIQTPPKAVAKPIAKVNTLPAKVETKSTPVVATGNFSIQIGAYSKEDGASQTKSTYQQKFRSNKIESSKVLINGKAMYKVFIKGFRSYEEAQEFKNANNLNNAVISN